MKIIISPAKKMNGYDDGIPPERLPALLDKAEMLREYIRSLSREEVSEMWKCNEKLTELNYRRFQEMDLKRNLTPALLAYEGIQYQHMAPAVFDCRQWEYVEKHLRILSGFYGILRPLDGVVPYRLEMQAKGRFPAADGAAGKNGTGQMPGESRISTLYGFWKDDLYRELAEPEGTTILNLASLEYSKGVEPYIKEGDRFISCVFGQREPDRDGKGRIRVKGTEAKIARGEMVRFMASRQVEDLEQIKAFSVLGYQYQEKLSNDKQFVFIKPGKK